MTSFAQTIYWRSPQVVKEVFAWCNAWRLDRLRHGLDYRQAIKQIHSRDLWSAEQFRDYQQGQLTALLAHARQHVPYYEQSLAGIDLAAITPDNLARLPILTKEVVRANPLALVDRRLDPGKLIVMHTSGTTGTPLRLFRDVALNSTAFAYVDARCREAFTRRRAGMRRAVNSSVTIGGNLVAAPGRSKPPFWVYNGRWKQLYMSSYHLSARNLPHYVQAMRRYACDYIEGYPSSLYAVARHIIDNRLTPVTFKCAFTTAETLLEHQRGAIEQAFGCRLYDQYGAGEMCVLAAECEAGSMHISPDYGIVEVVDNAGLPVPAGTRGHLVCTSLVNFVQPFIRYRVGDIGAIAAAPCECGSSLPVLAQLEGRVDSVLMTRDGRPIGRLDPVFKGAQGIAEAQIVQDDFERFRVRIVPGADYKPKHGQAVVEALAHRVGAAAISLELVEQIERTAAGKFKAVVCNIPTAVGGV